LFFRISAFPIRIPALRDRPEDIEKLIMHLAQQLSMGLGNRSEFAIEKDAIWLLKTFPWPGNVRQLRNVVECLIIRSNGVTVTAQQVQKVLREQSRQRLHKDTSAASSYSTSLSPVESVTDYRSFFVSNGKLIIADHLKSVEKEVIAAAITAAHQDYNLAAQMLHLSVAELYEKKELHGL
jgi:DNA-binding NtrC family response regulator